MPVDRPVHGDDHDWLDGDAGPVVRPYTLIGGRGRPAARLDLVAYVIALDHAVEPARYLAPEHRQILEVAHQPISVAEIAGELNLALGVVRVMLGDLLAEGLIAVHEPQADTEPPEETTLEAVINGLRAL
jgi:hypothetical protein